MMKYVTHLLPYWHPIDNPPARESCVLAYYTDDWGEHYVVANYTHDDEWWFPGSDKKDYTMVAWQELPNKPLFKRVDPK